MNSLIAYKSFVFILECCVKAYRRFAKIYTNVFQKCLLWIITNIPHYNLVWKSFSRYGTRSGLTNIAFLHWSTIICYTLNYGKHFNGIEWSRAHLRVAQWAHHTPLNPGSTQPCCHPTPSVSGVGVRCGWERVAGDGCEWATVARGCGWVKVRCGWVREWGWAERFLTELLEESNGEDKHACDICTHKLTIENLIGAKQTWSF